MYLVSVRTVLGAGYLAVRKTNLPHGDHIIVGIDKKLTDRNSIKQISTINAGKKIKSRGEDIYCQR